ncbi:Ig-like domain-containing protein [Olsenella uli]|uniref:Ig-like domain-containing protein n=1 Tax=Olsenella uli TaxID=133926 RepID=UPI0004453CD6|nr:Ig-like domain-containing protein [Olsenella uli]EUB30589.1 Ig-like domain, group 2 protein [Olsenella uli MSTE5]
MDKKNGSRLPWLVIAIMSAIVAIMCAVGQPGAGAEDDEGIWDLHRAYGDLYVNLGDTVTFAVDVVDYDTAEVIGDNATEVIAESADAEGEGDQAAEGESEAEPREQSEDDKGDGEEKPEDGEIDLSQFKFQWYWCQHNDETGEIMYEPIEGANEPTYTIDRVSEVDLYDNNELEFVCALFPADATDLSYGNRINVSSIWFSLSLMPDDYVQTGTTQHVTVNPEGQDSKGGYVAFVTNEAGTFDFQVSGVSDAATSPSVYVAAIQGDCVVAEYESDKTSFSLACDPAYTYVISWSADATKPVSFDYTISGEVSEPAYVDLNESLEPTDEGLNVYVDAVTLREDGEYQLTVANPWVDADYSIDDESVATVSDDGKIWAVGPGEATITVTQGDETAAVAVNVG